MPPILPRALLALAAGALLSSCAATHPNTGRTPTSSSSEMVCGKLALLVPDYLDGCPDGSGACAWFDGAHWVLQYPSNDPVALAHEKEHACGMVHKQPWARVGFLGVDGCAEVTEGGETQWRAGDVMCRGFSGGIRKETDPARIARVREIQSQSPAPNLSKRDAVK